MSTPTHPGQSSFAMDFSDEDGSDRPGEEMDKFVARLREVANGFGFDIQTWGPTEKFIQAIAPTYSYRKFPTA